MAIREPINTWTHAAGAALAALGTAILIAVSEGEPDKLVGGLVFGLSMLLMYAASSLYHGVVAPAPVLERLRKLDHAAIFLFIAGTYTPVVLAGLGPGFRAPVLALVWGLAALGVGVKLWRVDLPRWVSTLGYLGLGWLAVTLLPFMRLPAPAVAWIAVGGAVYSLGALIYAARRPNPWPGVLGFHELWHLAVLAGSAAMYAAVLVLFAGGRASG